MSDAPQTAAELELRRLSIDCIGFVVSSWEEQHRNGRRCPWPEYKLLHGPIIRALVNREDVNLLGAYAGDKIVGWLAWTPGKLPAVHFAYVRYSAAAADNYQRRGLFLRMLDHAKIGGRFIYTHRGRIHQARGGLKRRGEQPVTRDQVIVKALARRGIAAAFVPAAEWLERNP